MPFPDEAFSTGVVVGESAAWAVEGAALVDRVRQLVPDAVAVDHIGSTAVPGLAAKDCLDVMVRVRDLDAGDELVVAGYRERPEPWNREEVTDGRTFAKRVFAPAVGARSANLHVRVEGGANVRFALLFRDFLRADTEARDQWGGFKRRLAEVVPDLAAYGQVKAAAYPLLMRAAEAWAVETGWDPGATLPAHPDM
jgi:GrpB-like predicted nucleotidyltransferase (UPF0157 family)